MFTDLLFFSVIMGPKKSNLYIIVVLELLLGKCLAPFLGLTHRLERWSGGLLLEPPVGDRLVVSLVHLLHIMSLHGRDSESSRSAIVLWDT